MQRYRLTLEFDGSAFVGWQYQTNGLTVQEVVETAIGRFCAKVPRIMSAGRTDSGVHALGMVAHADIDRDMSVDRLFEALNFHMRPYPVVVREIAPVMQKRLHSFADHPLVGNTRGVGLVGAIELVADKATGKPFNPKQMVGAHCMDRAQEHGLITRAMGDALGFCPPLVITAEEINLMFDRFEKALDETTHWVEKEGLREKAVRMVRNSLERSALVHLEDADGFREWWPAPPPDANHPVDVDLEDVAIVAVLRSESGQGSR